MALAACLLGYGEVGLWLKREAMRPNSLVKIEGNPYLKWIKGYSGDGYQAAVKRGLGELEAVFRTAHHTYNACIKDRIETMAAADPPSPKRFQEWSLVWEKCTRLEKEFWDMAMNLS